MTELTALQDRVEELEMALGQSDDFLISLAAHFGLHGIQAQIVAMLLERQGITHEGAHAVLYGRRPSRSQPTMATIKGHVRHCRKKLEPFGIEIDRLIGLGYRLTPENKQKLRHLLQQEAA
jgi:DNA-binding response OmpR family regulator